ncbi:unnamed protein product [Rhizophagus irregularis]|nr:unnamed protein product [Rhizophagus irregularis]
MYLDPIILIYTALASNLKHIYFASIHSTSRACANVVVDLASRPEYMQELNEKILDSFIRESLRFTGDVAALPTLGIKRSHTFSNGLQVPKASKVGRNFLTFGGGKHMCPGRFLAINEIKFFMHNAILNYNIRTESGKIEDKFSVSPVALPSNNGNHFREEG